MIIDEGGKYRSVRTTDEDKQILKAALKRMSDGERRAFLALLRDATSVSTGPEATSLRDQILDAEFRTRPVDMETFVKDPYFLGETCTSIYPKLLDDLTEIFSGGYNEVILTGSIGLDSIIAEADGGLPTLEERLDKAKDVLVLKDKGLEVSTTEPAHHSGYKAVLRLTLANGMRIDLTPDHEVQVYRGKVVWVRADKIEIGERVLCARRVRTTPSENLDPDIAKLLAYWVADGSSSPTRARFDDGSKRTVGEVQELLAKLGFDSVMEPEPGSNSWEARVRNVKKSGFLDFLAKYGADSKTKEVSVPDAVCRSSNEIVALFLNRLWACKGTVYCPESGCSPPRFTLGMTSERIIRQVQLLLLRFGIQSRIREVFYTDKRVNKQHHIWHMAVAGIDNLELFLKHIGPVFSKEVASSRIATYCAAKTANTNVDVLPETWGWLNDEMVSHNIVRKKGKWWGLGTMRSRHLSRNKFYNWLRDYGSTDLGKKLTDQFPEDISYEYVDSIEPISIDIPVGDIGAHNGNRFIANGISVHNSIGWGKSWISSIGICRILYELSCLKNPQHTYGLAEGSTMSIVVLSVTEQLATKVAFEYILTKLQASPYFREQFPFKSTKKEIRFPNHIWLAPRATSDTSALGLSPIGGFMDELNFLKKPVRSVRNSPGQEKYDQAETLYNAIKRRMKSRFEKRGRFPGVLFLASSKNTSDDFTMKRIKESQNDPTIYVMDYSAWDVHPDDYDVDNGFHVFIGNEMMPSRILEDNEVDKLKQSTPEGTKVLLIPAEFKIDFTRDIEGAIRDIAGMATAAIRPFITQREKITDAEKVERVHPFTTELFDMSRGGAILWNSMIKQVKDYTGLSYKPIISPDAARHVHIDPSLRGDRTGFCMSHVCGWKNVIRRNPDGFEYVERAPVYFIDFVLGIIPPIGSEIILGDIRKMIYDFTAHGYLITRVSQDSYQSADSLQTLARKGYSSELVSVDVSADAYDNYKLALYEDRVVGYPYEPLRIELRRLEKNAHSGKVDHPPRGCFVGNTRIPLLDGSHPQIQDLVGREVWVYSSDSDGGLVPGKARGRLTKYTKDLVDVVLDSGAVERCTPDHLWRLRDGSYKEAKDLRPGIDRLMPIKRTWPVNGGYERIGDKTTSRQGLTHHIIWKFMTGCLIPTGSCIHHINEIKIDNRPDNLELSTKSEHSHYHTKARHEVDAAYTAKAVVGLKKFNNSEDGRRKHSESMRRTVAAMTQEELTARARARKDFRSDITIDSINNIKNETEATNAGSAARILGCGRNVIIRVLRDNGFSSWNNYISGELGNNHKVRAVINVNLKDPVPVYDLEVDEHSNFALCSGVFVHNSKDISDAVAGCLWTLSRAHIESPLPIISTNSGNSATWAPLAYAASGSGVSSMFDSSSAGMIDLPPFLVGSDGSDGWY